MKAQRRTYLQARAAARIGANVELRKTGTKIAVLVDGEEIGTVNAGQAGKLIKLGRRLKWTTPKNVVDTVFSLAEDPGPDLDMFVHKHRMPRPGSRLVTDPPWSAVQQQPYTNPPYSDAPKTFKQ